jgi:hypothetical protein
MIRLLNGACGKVLGVKASGLLVDHDYRQFVPILEESIAEHGRIRCLVELTDLDGIEMRALWSEIPIHLRRARQIERCAVVGDRGWDAWLPRLCRPILVNAEVRVFDQAEREMAWEWINEGL